MFVGTDDAVNFRSIIDIENVTVKNHRDANASNGQLLNFGSCSLSVNNLTLQDINVKGNSILLNNSKGIVSGLTVERDTSQNEIINISNGSKIDFYNLKISQSKTNDGNGLYITGNAVVKIDTLDIKDSYWGCSSGNCYGGTGESISVYNADFTLDNGKFSNIHAEGEGSALRADDGSRVEISNTLVDSSYSEGAGGGMVFYQSDYVSIKNSSFIANRSVNGGGGIHVNEVDSLFLYNSTFIADSSQGGGAVELGGGKYYHLDGNVMENNYSADGAGAINLWGNDKVEIFNSKFISNKSVNDGGAIYSWNTDSLFIDNSTFNGNESTDGNGGAMTFKGDANSTLYCEIKNTTFENNSGGWGGAIAAFEPINMNIYSVFATGNKASGNGGFIELCCGASVSITNSTIYNNDSNNNDLNGCSDCKMFVTNSIIWKDKIGGPSDATIEITYSDIEGGWDGEGNIDADPHFIDAANGDYHIGDYSPCIGAGVYSAQFDDTWYYAPSTDLDGNPRPNPAGSMPDMGAYENPRATPQHAPEPFELVFPFDSTHIGITRHNYLDTLYFAWNQAIDPDGDKVTYRRELTGDLQEYIKFIVTSDEETTTNMYRIPYHHIEHYMHTAGVEFVQGTWTIVASDGGMDTYASNGPFLLTIDASAVNVEELKVIPESFALHANYPNPFNPTTTISYDLPKRSQVTLGIYDILGKKIKTLLNQSQDAGKRIAIWDGTDNLGRQVSAGVYLYQIQAGAFTQTRKMLLLK
jgi:predicted outer membrane repeat protein